MSSYPVEDALEQAVNKQVTALIGNNDVNLNTIIKMSLMNEYNQVNSKELQDVLARIASNNEVEKYYVEKEYELTYDCGGNIVPIIETKSQLGRRPYNFSIDLFFKFIYFNFSLIHFFKLS